jgi:hypothetical protein
VTPAKTPQTRSKAKPVKGSDWDKNFDLKKGPKIWQAAQSSGAKREESL